MGLPPNLAHDPHVSIPTAGFLEKVYEKAIDEIHLAQCLNYLKATGLHLCLLLYFGKPRLEIKRIVLAL
jgi:PD-(D/E)XK nuclease superfamily